MYVLCTLHNSKHCSLEITVYYEHLPHLHTPFIESDIKIEVDLVAEEMAE